MVWTLDRNGWICGDTSIIPMPRPNIEHGELRKVNGIIVHQTASPTVEATLNSYRNKAANGAHFLIGKDGKTYQVASLFKKTWHIGKLRAKCIASHSCSDAEFKLIREQKYNQIHRVEMHKSVPLRFPSNEDSIGIELVGNCILDKKFIRPGMTAPEIQDLTSEKGIYEEVTKAQNTSLDGLIRQIQSTLHVPEREVFSHPDVSMKNPTEAATAQWIGRQ